MAKQKTVVPFKGTAEQEAKLREVIAAHRDMQGALMPVLQKAQDIYGYLPVEVQNIIAQRMGVSLEEVYGVASFYSQFSLNPKGKVAIGVCLGTACYVKGSQGILERISLKLGGLAAGSTSSDGKYSIEATRCIGACGIAPAVSINGKVYPKVAVSAVKGIIDEYKALGGAN